MSLILCDDCEDPIDSDVDCDCFVKIRPGKMAVLCKWCQEEPECEIATIPCPCCSGKGVVSDAVCLECSGDGDIEVGDEQAFGLEAAE